MLKIERLPDSAKFLHPYMSRLYRARYDEGARLSQLGIAILKAGINGFLMGVIHAEEISAQPKCARTAREVANLGHESPLGDWCSQFVMAAGALNRLTSPKEES